jgi:hypothetical protein
MIVRLNPIRNSEKSQSENILFGGTNLQEPNTQVRPFRQIKKKRIAITDNPLFFLRPFFIVTDQASEPVFRRSEYPEWQEK